MTSIQRKMKPNEWLDSSSDKGRKFLSKLDFYDKYYFESLAIHLTDFLRNTPVPILTTWDAKHKRIYFSIGKESIYFPVDTEIVYKDYIRQVERWAHDFYPQYTLQVETCIPLTDDEIFEKVKKEGYDLNDAIMSTKNVTIQEVGVIERIYILEDKFKFKQNSDYSIRISGVPNKKIIPLSSFLKEIRKISDDEDIKNYIFENSFEVKKLYFPYEEELIDYSGRKMVNFFKINLPDLTGHPIKKVDRDEISWGKYKIKFESDILRDDCMIYARDNDIEII